MVVKVFLNKLKRDKRKTKEALSSWACRRTNVFVFDY